MTESVFTLACKKGHEIDLPPDEAKLKYLSGCLVCHKPLFIKGVRTEEDADG
jgi:hypothetical protein